MVFFTYGIVYNNTFNRRNITRSMIWPIIFIIRIIKILLFMIHELLAMVLDLYGLSYTDSNRYKTIQNYLDN